MHCAKYNGSPAVAPGGSGSRKVGGGGKRKWEWEDSRREQPALMPPLGHYRRPASNRGGCSQLFQGRFPGTLSGDVLRTLSKAAFYDIFVGDPSEDSFQGCFWGFFPGALSGTVSRALSRGAI